MTVRRDSADCSQVPPALVDAATVPPVAPLPSAQAEQDQEWFAATFHLGQLPKEQPNDDLKRRRDHALQKLKLRNRMEPLPHP
jgi:hypothetical protein